MSEYQYYEWQTIDRPLSEKEIEAVERLSSHIEVGPTQAVVTYNWSDFKHDPQEVLLKYFDAHWYAANWGSQRLMFRFPKGGLDEKTVGDYCDQEVVTFQVVGEYAVLDISMPAEYGLETVEYEGVLATLARLREDLIEGDYRLLYLAWLLAISIYLDEEGSAQTIEPPVPSGLDQLNSPLRRFIDIFDLDPFLVKAAAQASPALLPTADLDLRPLITQLSRPECDDFLLRLVNREPGLAAALHKRLLGVRQQTSNETSERRSLASLLAAAEDLKTAEKRRKAEQARKNHIQAMKALATREGQAWQEVVQLLESGKTASIYDQATALLSQLMQLSEFQDNRDIFAARLKALAEKYSGRPSLLRRWKENGWL